MNLSEEAKRQARLAAQGVKDEAGAQTLWPKSETTQEMEKGSPRTPGHQPDYGQTMKSAPQWPQARETEQDRDRDSPDDNDIDR
jgi:hypothetical protein